MCWKSKFGVLFAIWVWNGGQAAGDKVPGLSNFPNPCSVSLLGAVHTYFANNPTLMVLKNRFPDFEREIARVSNFVLGETLYLPASDWSRFLTPPRSGVATGKSPNGMHLFLFLDPISPEEIEDFANDYDALQLVVDWGVEQNIFRRLSGRYAQTKYLDALTSRESSNGVVLIAPPPDVKLSGAILEALKTDERFADLPRLLFASPQHRVSSTEYLEQVTAVEYHGVSFDELNSEALRQGIELGASLPADRYSAVDARTFYLVGLGDGNESYVGSWLREAIAGLDRTGSERRIQILVPLAFNRLDENSLVWELAGALLGRGIRDSSTIRVEGALDPRSASSARVSFAPESGAPFTATITFY